MQSANKIKKTSLYVLLDYFIIRYKINTSNTSYKAWLTLLHYFIFKKITNNAFLNVEIYFKSN